MRTNWFFWLFFSLFFLHHFWEIYLTRLNVAHIQKHQNTIPPYFQDKINSEEYQKGIRYNLERSRFSQWVSWINVPIVWGVILLGGFDFLGRLFGSSHGNTSLTSSVLYCATVGLILMLLFLPFSCYSQFVIEEKYGFNKMTGKTFLLDRIKTLALSALLGIPLLYLIFWLYQKAGSSWWLWAFAALFAFKLFITAIYPSWLAPIFNKFTLLAEGTLKDEIFKIAQKVHFKLSGIYTIDGSRRSTHSNAYFAGIGKMRRIVLFDTLIDQLSEPELVSVLAHEMGHNKKKHVQKGLFFSFFFTLAGFWLLSYIIDWPLFYSAFNAGMAIPHKGFVLFALFLSHFTFFLTPVANALSRKYEYEADQFSAEATGNKETMASALVELSRENLANLTPHPLYSFYHYSHPTTLERIRAIEQTQL